MHRTTINLGEATYQSVKKLAARRGKSMARTIEDLLRQSLRSPQESTKDVPPLYKDNGPLPGVDISDRDRLYDLMDDDVRR